MRTFIIILCILVIAIGAVALYLVLSTPNDAPPLRFPLTASQQELLARVPSNADAYALIPAPAVLMHKLIVNSTTSAAATQWMDEHTLPPAYLLGRADAVIWKDDKRTSYAVHLDPLRAFVGRLWTMVRHADARWDGNTLIVDSGESQAPMSPPPELHPAIGLPEGDAFIVQRSEARGAFPPIGRPAMTSLRIDGKVIDITSRAITKDTDPRPMTRPALARGAMLSVAFTDPPAILGALDRVTPADITALVDDGGAIALYDVDTGTLFPRPFAAIALPADDRGRAALAEYARIISTVGTQLEHNGELVISFDRNSAPRYAQDAKAPLPWPSNRWAVRIDPKRFVPVLREVADNPMLRLTAPRLHRGARDLERWMDALEGAETVEAARSVGGGFEELRVRIASK